MASQKRHEIKRKDWEVVLDQLYKRCIAPTARGIGIISNTSRENSGDVEGELQEELTYRVKEREQGNLAYKMRQFNTEAFYNFFKLRSQSKKEDSYPLANNNWITIRSNMGHCFFFFGLE